MRAAVATPLCLCGFFTLGAYFPPMRCREVWRDVPDCPHCALAACAKNTDAALQALAEAKHGLLASV